MVDLFSQEGLKATERGKVKELMTITYTKQGEDLNADPPPSILDISKKWPFLLSWKFLLSHFTTLTGVELYARLNEDLDKKGKRLLEFFRRSADEVEEECQSSPERRLEGGLRGHRWSCSDAGHDDTFQRSRERPFSPC